MDAINSINLSKGNHFNPHYTIYHCAYLFMNIYNIHICKLCKGVKNDYFRWISRVHRIYIKLKNSSGGQVKNKHPVRKNLASHKR